MINFTEHDFSGQKIVEVKYRYKYIDVADWINNPEIKAAFPEIDETLNKANKVKTIGLMETNNGWQARL